MDWREQRLKRRRMLSRRVPLWLVLILSFVLLVPSIYAVLTVQTRTYISLFGEIVDVTEDLDVVSQGVDVQNSNKAAQGAEPGSPVTLDPGENAKARTALTKGHYVYSVEASVATVSANTKYNCTLYMEVSEQWENKGSLYVKQSSTPSIGDKALLTWDIGTTLNSTVFKLEIEIYT